MTGALKLTTKFLLPPGQTGTWSIGCGWNGRFTIGQRAKFANLQRPGQGSSSSVYRGRGKGSDAAGSTEPVASDFAGRFVSRRRPASICPR